MFHLRDSSGSAADLWAAEMEEKDILLWQNTPNVNPKFRWVPAVSMGMVRRSPSPAQGGPEALPGTPSLLAQTLPSRLLPSSSSASFLSAQAEHQPSLQHPGKPFPGKSGCQWDPSFMDICQKGKFQFPPQNIRLTAELCNASRSHFREQVLSTKHNVSMNAIAQRGEQHPAEQPC